MSESLSSVLGNSPTLRGVPLPSFWGKARDNIVEGLDGSVGSSFELPADSTSAITLRDFTGSTIWTLSIANVAAALAGSATNWVGFWLDDAGTSLKVVTRDSAAAPRDDYAVVGVNLAKTIVEAGASQPPTTDFAVLPDWGNDGWIQPDGSGGFTLYSSTGTVANSEKMTMTSAGVVSDPTALFTANAEQSQASPGYETSNGYLFGQMGYSEANDTVKVIISNKTENLSMLLPFDTNLTAPGGFGPFLEWKDYVVNIDFTNSIGRALLKYTPAQIAAYAQELADSAGISL